MDSDVTKADERFCQAWRDGKPEQIEAFLPADANSPDYVSMLVDLISAEMELSWRRYHEQTSSGVQSALEGPQLEDYLKRFPCLRAAPEQVLELAKDECRIRHAYGIPNIPGY